MKPPFFEVDYADNISVRFVEHGGCEILLRKGDETLATVRTWALGNPGYETVVHVFREEPSESPADTKDYLVATFHDHARKGVFANLREANLKEENEKS